MLDTLINKPYNFYNMKFIKNNLYNCLHDCIIKKECAFSKGHIYKCVEPNILKGNNDEHINLNDFNINWDCYFSLAVSSTDNVNHPPHYTWLKDKCGIEVIDIIRHMDFCLGCAIKYILRAGHKQDSLLSKNQKEIEDLKKAIFYINDRIAQIEGKYDKDK